MYAVYVLAYRFFGKQLFWADVSYCLELAQYLGLPGPPNGSVPPCDLPACKRYLCHKRNPFSTNLKYIYCMYNVYV